MSKLSFLPDDYVDGRIERRTNAVCLTLFLIMLVAIGAAYLITNQQRTDVRHQHRKINEQFKEEALRIGQLEELQVRKKDMIRKARVTAQLVEQVPRTLILSELVNNMPDTMSLLNLDLKTVAIRKRVKASTVLEAEKRRKSRSAKTNLDEPFEAHVNSIRVDLSIIGVAPTDVIVAKFMHAIGQCALFKEVSLSFSEEVLFDQDTMRKFQIDMELVHDLNLNEFKPKQIPRLTRAPIGKQLSIAPND